MSILHPEYPRPGKFGIQPKLGGAVVRPELGEVDLQGSAWPPPEVWAEKDREIWLKNLPENPTEEEMDVIREKIKTIYAPVFVSDGKRMRGPIVGDPMKITLKEDAVPFAIHSARKVPLAKQPKFKEEIHKMAENGQISWLKDVPTEWCHPIVVADKPNGDVRITSDVDKLNKQVVRSTHPTLTPQQAIQGFKKEDKFFSKLDLRKGYWQMALDEESKMLTCSICSEGKFVYNVALMGFISTGDSFTYRCDVAMAGLPINKVVDDIAFGAATYQELMRLQLAVLERCAKYNMTVNAEKSTLARAKKINFVGYEISENEIRIDDRKIAAIKDFPIPNDRSALKSFMALANQLGEVAPEFSKTAEPLRHLLSQKNEFLWLADHTIVFEKIKDILTSDRCRAMYDLSLIHI